MAGDQVDEEVARLTADYATLKIEHARVSATARKASDLEEHVIHLRAHILRLHVCIKKMRQQSTEIQGSPSGADLTEPTRR